MKLLRYLLLGILFGITMAKSEVVSWYRIYEMFHFQSFHMYGIIGSAVVLGILIVQIIKRRHLNSTEVEAITFTDKAMSVPRYLIGGIIFGLGWAISGACPGPMFVLLGGGYSVFLVVIASAILGTLAYGVLRDKLPH